MNIQEYISYAKRVLNEDAGSEGMVYQVRAKAGLKPVETKSLVINEVVEQNGELVADVNFVYPHDYGFAVSMIKEALEDIELVAVTLVY